MTRRFFVEEPITGEHATLAGSEAHHLVHVLRAQVGTPVILFDGAGSEFDATITVLERASVHLAITATRTPDRELACYLELCVALPKGDRQKWLVEKCVELGVAKLVPLKTSRSVSQPTGNALARLRRAVIEASKQCGRNRLMEVAQPQSLPQRVADLAAARPANLTSLVVHPGGADWSQHFRSEYANRSTEKRASVLALIGPEGGFDDEEIALAHAAEIPTIDLGPRILRIETAALFVAVACQVSA